MIIMQSVLGKEEHNMVIDQRYTVPSTTNPKLTESCLGYNYIYLTH